MNKDNKVKLVPAICSQCGANIEVDKDLEKGFCTYCGTKIIIKDVIQKVKIVDNPTFKNYMKLADRYYEDKNYSEALENYKLALEINPDYWLAIYRNGICKTRTTTLASYDIESTINGCKNALKIYEDEEKDNEIIAKTKISMGLDLVNICNLMYEFSLNHYNEYWDLENSASEMWNQLLSLRTCAQYARDVLVNEEIIKLCPKTEVGDDTFALRNLILKQIILINTTICEVRKYKSGYTQYGDVYSNTKVRDDIRVSLVQEYDECVAEIKTRNSEYVPSKINRNGKSKGCYVATAVYGSYDCPEVWTLRRFRDFYLENTRLGRAFIKIYYKISPVVVRKFGNNIYFNRINKKILNKLVRKLQQNGYSDIPYNDKY